MVVVGGEFLKLVQVTVALAVAVQVLAVTLLLNQVAQQLQDKEKMVVLVVQALIQLAVVVVEQMR